GIATSCVSRRQPFGKSGRIGRSIIRAVSVPFSPARPSRLKKLPGILPAAYMRSSTSTVRGRKSTSRGLPGVAVQRACVSPGGGAEEADVAAFPRGGGEGPLRLPCRNAHAAARLLGELAGLELDRTPAHL